MSSVALSWLLMIAAFSAQEGASSNVQTATAPEEAPAAPDRTYANGPLRVELVAMLEGRYRYFDESMGQQRQPEMRMQLRVAGAEIGSVVRQGTLLLEEVVDDTGESLFDPSTITDEQRNVTRLTTEPKERLESQGMLAVAQCKASNRAAKTLRVVKGSIRLVFASGYEEVTILNPMQYVGKTIENERLKALGVEVSLLAAEQLETEIEPTKSIVLQYAKGEGQIRSVNLFDQWMKVIRTRPTPATTKDGKEATNLRVLSGEIDTTSQLVLQVFPNAREEVVRFELKDVELP
ncbi:MAG: hypothetical protein AB7N71_15390 [Phycisphaerae bacterium]